MGTGSKVREEVKKAVGVGGGGPRKVPGQQWGQLMLDRVDFRDKSLCVMQGALSAPQPKKRRQTVEPRTMWHYFLPCDPRKQES